MRYAIVSDIHANLQAWKSVWLDIRSMGVDQVISLGDLVGYGPNPKEVLESVYTTIDYFVLGNHDAALSGQVDDSCFSEAAREVLRWTAGQVGHSATQFLSKLPLSLAGPDFRCAHGDLAEPGRFRYIFEPADAMPAWAAVSEPLLFVGHTHLPCIMVIGRSGTPHMIPPEDFVLEEGKRFLVNAGSVGQPRDDDIRSSYCIYDADAGAVYWRKIPFDLDAYREALDRAGLSSQSNAFLNWDPRVGRPPVRDLVPFSPPSRPAEAAATVADIIPLPAMQQRLRKWKVLFAAAAGLLLLFIAGAVWAWREARAGRVETAAMTGVGMDAIRAADYALENNLLSFPSTPVPQGQPIAHWMVQVGDRDRQGVGWGSVAGAKTGFILQSDNPQREVVVTSSPIHVNRDMRLSMQGLVKKSPDFKGTLTLALVLVQTPDLVPVGRNGTFETNSTYLVAEPRQPRQDGWWQAQKTMDGKLPARAHSILLVIRGVFQGTVGIRDLRVERKE